MYIYLFVCVVPYRETGNAVDRGAKITFEVFSPLILHENRYFNKKGEIRLLFILAPIQNIPKVEMR